jgi:hypothetical protein
MLAWLALVKRNRMKTGDGEIRDKPELHARSLPAPYKPSEMSGQDVESELGSQPVHELPDTSLPVEIGEREGEERGEGEGKGRVGT